MKRFLPVAVLALVLASCQGQKDFTIRTTPEGATIAINGRPYEGQKTPMTIKIDQDKDLGITAMKPGYEVASRTVETQTSTWGAILWNKHDPRARYIAEDEVTIEMKKIPTAAGFSPGSMPGYQPPASSSSSVPELRPMPKF